METMTASDATYHICHFPPQDELQLLGCVIYPLNPLLWVMTVSVFGLIKNLVEIFLELQSVYLLV